jgi:hypothetical protein
MITGIYERRFYTVEVGNDLYERGSAKEWIKYNQTTDNYEEVADPTYIETAFQAAMDTEIHYLIDEDSEDEV